MPNGLIILKVRYSLEKHTINNPIYVHTIAKYEKHLFKKQILLYSFYTNLLHKKSRIINLMIHIVAVITY